MLGRQAEKSVCWPFASLFDSELTLMYAVLLALLLAGGVVIYATCRWYRTLKQREPTSSDDLAQLARALQVQDVIDPEEAERIRIAVERAQSEIRTPKAETNPDARTESQ
jgi:hypothetical protein